MQSFGSSGNTIFAPASITEEQRKKITRCGLKLSRNHAAILRTKRNRTTFVSGVVARRSLTAAIIAPAPAKGQSV
jgi:hypothetical protein